MEGDTTEIIRPTDRHPDQWYQVQRFYTDDEARLNLYNFVVMHDKGHDIAQMDAELGCKDTNYNNPHGLHGKTHHSTAYDLCLIQRACYAHKTYRSIIKKKKYTFSTVDGNYTHTAYTSDDLLYEDISGFKGGKTGWIEEAGCCFSGVFEYKGETYYFTVLGSEFSDPRWKDCRKLMSYIKKYA